MTEVYFFAVFFFIIGLILFADLALVKQKDGTVSMKQAGVMSTIVIVFALLFYVGLMQYGHMLHGIDSMEHPQQVIDKHQHPIQVIPGNLEASIERYNTNLSMEFITGYIIEYALSVDNIFVILLIFSSFKVAPRNYHKVLLWGILGAIIMRFIFIFVGASLINRFGWIMYVFGAFLVFTGLKMLFGKDHDEDIDTEKHIVVRTAKKFIKVYPQFVKDKFFVRSKGVLMATPLFLVVLIIEFTDLLFAVDSIPAIFSVTHDPYIVFFSNIFAIIGLRSMFFLLAGIVNKFRFLSTGLAVLLTFIGLKMLFHNKLHDWGFSTTQSLLVIVCILSLSIVFSLIFPEKKHLPEEK